MKVLIRNAEHTEQIVNVKSIPLVRWNSTGRRMRLFEEPELFKLAHHTSNSGGAQTRGVSKLFSDGVRADGFAGDEVFVDDCREDGLAAGIGKTGGFLDLQ